MIASEGFTSRQEVSSQAVTTAMTSGSKQLPEYKCTEKNKINSFSGFFCFLNVHIQ